jgi:hypothetical protein
MFLPLYGLKDIFNIEIDSYLIILL